jgi:hypothetical protein
VQDEQGGRPFGSKSRRVTVAGAGDILGKALRSFSAFGGRMMQWCGAPVCGNAGIGYVTPTTNTRFCVVG